MEKFENETLLHMYLPQLLYYYYNHYSSQTIYACYIVIITHFIVRVVIGFNRPFGDLDGTFTMMLIFKN